MSLGNFPLPSFSEAGIQTFTLSTGSFPPTTRNLLSACALSLPCTPSFPCLFFSCCLNPRMFCVAYVLTQWVISGSTQLSFSVSLLDSGFTGLFDLEIQHTIICCLGTFSSLYYESEAGYYYTIYRMCLACLHCLPGLWTHHWEGGHQTFLHKTGLRNHLIFSSTYFPGLNINNGSIFLFPSVLRFFGLDLCHCRFVLFPKTSGPADYLPPPFTLGSHGSVLTQTSWLFLPVKVELLAPSLPKPRC